MVVSNYRVDYSVYYLDSDKLSSGSFLGKAVTEQSKYDILAKPTDNKIIDHDAEHSCGCELLQGQIVFADKTDAVTFFETMKDDIKTRVGFLYADILLLDNTHHLKNPLPDVIIDRIQLGNEKLVS